MIDQDVLDDIIAGFDPINIAPEYIIMAKVTGFDGRSYVLSGDDLKDFMKNPAEYATEVRIIPDVRKISKAIIDEVNDLLEAINEKFEEDF